MIRVRKHRRQLASGKTATVRQHERAGNPAPSGEWSDHPPSDPPEGTFADQPEGTWYFRQDGEICAVHPDGTVRRMTDDGTPEETFADQPEGTWYLRQGDGVYAVRPDGSARRMTDDEPDYPDDSPWLAAPDSGLDRIPGSTGDPREAHDRALAGTCSHGGHGWDGETCSDIDDAAVVNGEPSPQREDTAMAKETRRADGPIGQDGRKAGPGLVKDAATPQEVIKAAVDAGEISLSEAADLIRELKLY